MSRWFRFQAAAMRNPKVMKLSDKDFRLWVRMLSIASENDGKLPGDDDLKLLLSMRLDHLKGGLDRLIRGGLIDLLDGGYVPHDWNEHQYKSDTSTERVKRHRKKRNVSETPPDTDTDTYSVEDKSSTNADASEVDLDKVAFDLGARLIRATGKTESEARSIIGKWRKNHGNGETLEAIIRAEREKPADAVEFISGRLRWVARRQAPAVSEYQGGGGVSMPC
ncbi:hypothetical protein ACSMXM_05560 [Pacificimonas sp. ICDLI1SI03]